MQGVPQDTAKPEQTYVDKGVLRRTECGLSVTKAPKEDRCRTDVAMHRGTPSEAACIRHTSFITSSTPTLTTS